MAGRDERSRSAPLAQAGVRDRATALVPERGLHRLGGQGGERRLARRSAVAPSVMTGRDVGTGVDQATAHLDRLVGGDAAGDAEDDAPPGEAWHGLRCRPR